MKKQETFFVENIKLLRQRKKKTQEIVALGLGMDRGRLAAFECGQLKKPSVEDLMKFSDYFKVSIDLLVKVDLREWSEFKWQEMVR